MARKFVLIDANNWFRRYMYSDRFLSVDGMIAELAAAKPDFLIWDGYNGNARRRAIFTDYKKARKERDIDTDFETLNMIRNDLMPYLPCASFWADGYEGDDLMNHTARLLALADKDNEIEIVSTDKDLAAILPGYPHLKNPLVSEKFIQTVGDRAWIPLYKTLVGDPSDGIPGLKGFGPKAWDSLSAWTRDKLCEVFSLGTSDVLAAVEPEEKALSKIQEHFSELKPMWDIVCFFSIEPTAVKCCPAEYNPKKIREILDTKGVL